MKKLYLPKFHWIYLLALVSILFLIPTIKRKINLSDEFFGLAENQIRSYTKASEVRIKKLYVKLGQEIKYGDTLMVFQPENLSYKKQDLVHQSKILDINKQSDQYLLQLNIDRLEQQKKVIIANYDIKIEKLKKEKKIADSIALAILQKATSNDKLLIEINAEEAQKASDLLALQQKINELKQQLASTPDPIFEKKSNITNEINRIIEQEKDLVLLSDVNGVVGQLDYLEGDVINAFQKIINLYSLHPTLVTSFIHEQYLGKVSLQDTVVIQSLSDPNYKIKGNILNLGSRITALPDRLKKLPELKVWGRELQIEIPKDNHLIQGEKVKVIFPMIQ